jgi:hypothetical protein
MKSVNINGNELLAYSINDIKNHNLFQICFDDDELKYDKYFHKFMKFSKTKELVNVAIDFTDAFSGYEVNGKIAVLKDCKVEREDGDYDGWFSLKTKNIEYFLPVDYRIHKINILNECL